MNVELWLGFVAVLFPAIISAIVKPEWPNWAKLLTSLAVSCALASLQIYLSGTWDVKNMSKTLAEVFALVMTSYAAFWRPFGIAQKIEEKINP